MVGGGDYMTATAASIADLIVGTVGKDWQYYPSDLPEVLDFVVDQKVFRIVVIEDAESVASVEILRYVEEDDMENDISAEEADEIAKAQALAAEGEVPPPMALDVFDEENPEFDLGGEG